jgi:hypothetical protein
MCANSQDMMQKPREAVFTHFARNVETFKQFMASKPDDTPQATAAISNQKQTFDNLARNSGQFFQTQMYIAGLHEPIRKENMKCTYANFQAVFDEALDLEVIQQDNKAAKPSTVVAVEETNPANTQYQ